MVTSLLPGQVGELRIHWARNHLCVDGPKLVHAIAERNDLSGADERAAKDRAETENVQQTHIYDEVSQWLAPQRLLTNPVGRRRRRDICLCSPTASAPWIHHQ